MGLRPREGLVEPRTRDRLEQIVDRADLECSDGVLIVSSDEHYRRHRFDADFIDNTEAIHLWHLDIEEDYVRAIIANSVDGFSAILRLMDFRYVRITGEQESQSLPREALVVDD